MMVKKGDLLARKNKFYRVVAADDEVFIIARVKAFFTDYTKLEAYANIESVMSLEDLGFEKIGHN